jgi:hypothetical protein
MAMFGSFYVCEQLFSFMKSTKLLSEQGWLINTCPLSSKSELHRHFSQTCQKLSLKRGVKPQDETLKMIE